MNKFIASILVLMLGYLAVSAQSDLDFRKVTKDGGLIIMSKSTRIKEKGQPSFEISIRYDNNINYDEIKINSYSLVVIFTNDNDQIQWEFPVNGRLLIKTSTDNVISLQQIVSNTGFDVANPDNGERNYEKKRGRHFNELAPDLSYYYTLGQYPISEDDLMSILNDGVIKLRIETTEVVIECNYPAKEEIRINGVKEWHNLISYRLLPLYEAVKMNVDPKADF